MLKDWETQKSFQYLFENTGTGMAIIESDNTISMANSKLAEILETDISNIVGTTFIQWVTDEDKAMLLKYHKARLRGAQNIPQNYNFRTQTAKNNIRWTSVEINFSKETNKTLVSVIDIDVFKQTERQLQEAIAAQNAVFAAVPDLMFELDADGYYINIWANNPQELAKSKEQLLGLTVSEALPIEATKQVMKALKEAEKKGQSFGRQIQIDTPDGQLWFELSVSPIDTHHTRQHFILLSRNITRHKQMEEKLLHLSNHDSLTNLYNRRILSKKLTKEIEKARRYNHPLSLFLFDIDYFKNINDTYGHDVGDTVLKTLGQLIKDSIREIDDAFRYGGEEFVIILADTPLSKAEELAQRLRKKIEKMPIASVKGDAISITVSIGVSSFTKDIESPDDLLKIADTRMYLAKHSGRNCVVAS